VVKYSGLSLPNETMAIRPYGQIQAFVHFVPRGPRIGHLHCMVLYRTFAKEGREVGGV